MAAAGCAVYLRTFTLDPGVVDLGAVYFARAGGGVPVIGGQADTLSVVPQRRRGVHVGAALARPDAAGWAGSPHEIDFTDTGGSVQD